MKIKWAAYPRIRVCDNGLRRDVYACGEGMHATANFKDILIRPLQESSPKKWTFPSTRWSDNAHDRYMDRRKNNRSSHLAWRIVIIPSRSFHSPKGSRCDRITLRPSSISSNCPVCSVGFRKRIFASILGSFECLCVDVDIIPISLTRPMRHGPPLITSSQ